MRAWFIPVLIPIIVFLKTWMGRKFTQNAATFTHAETQKRTVKTDKVLLFVVW